MQALPLHYTQLRPHGGQPSRAQADQSAHQFPSPQGRCPSLPRPGHPAHARYDPPRSPILHLYGAGFPTFLAALPDLAGHHYLPDIAAFEWALNIAEHAEDATLLRPEDLPDTDATAQLVLPLHPSAQRLSTPFPVSEGDGCRGAGLCRPGLGLARGFRGPYLAGGETGGRGRLYPL